MKQLEIDEGRRLRVYEDSLGYKTVGVGHLIKDSDPDEIKDLGMGDKITEQQCYELYTKDLVEAVSNANVVFHGVWQDFPSIAKEVFINMLFNLGAPRFLKFKKTIAAAHVLDWETVSIEMLDSVWAKQVGPRATRLSGKIRRL